MPRKKTTKEIENTISKIVEDVKEGAEKITEEIKEIAEKVKEDITDKASENKKKKAEPSKKSKLEVLKEKAKELEKKLEGQEIKTEELKKKVKPELEEKKDILVPIEDYLKSSIHLGTRVITPEMRQYVYKRRADGLAVFNTSILDDKIKESAEFLAKYAPGDVIVVCKREAGWKPVEMFSKATGIRCFTKNYPAGILTNPILEDFLETDLIVICDPWVDKNALQDAQKIKIPVLSVCDTNNYTLGITQILPGNNKSAKSLGMIFYLLAKVYTEKRNIKADIPPISEWIDNWDNLQPPK